MLFNVDASHPLINVKNSVYRFIITPVIQFNTAYSMVAFGHGAVYTAIKAPVQCGIVLDNGTVHPAVDFDINIPTPNPSYAYNILIVCA